MKISMLFLAQHADVYPFLHIIPIKAMCFSRFTILPSYVFRASQMYGKCTTTATAKLKKMNKENPINKCHGTNQSRHGIDHYGSMKMNDIVFIFIRLFICKVAIRFQILFLERREGIIFRFI
jgi:hypothetical protein